MDHCSSKAKKHRIYWLKHVQDPFGRMLFEDYICRTPASTKIQCTSDLDMKHR
uniref:Uncharacterized protein n=1 Tax=Arundo donax TaxID=35708 RepID=A0A0A9CBY2_ARUDO